MQTDWLRNEFPITRTKAYFNNAATTPMSLRTEAVLQEYTKDRINMAAAGNEKWNGYCNDVQGKMARLVGAGPQDIALTSGTSHAVSLVAGGFDWREGDEVIIVAPDFTANVYPWLHLKDKGVSARILKRSTDGGFSVDDVAAQISPRTRILAVTSVDFYSGYYADLTSLGALCRDKGIIFGVDAIQSLGVIPLDVGKMNIDFVACGAHKWMLGSRGGGFLYISERLREQVRPILYGWNSVKNPGAFAVDHELKDDAGRFQPGAPPYLVMATLGAGLDMVLSIGVEKIHKRVLYLNDRIKEGLDRLGYPVISNWEQKHRSAIMTFRPTGDANELCSFLAERNIAVTVRRDAIRVSPCFYNDETDIDRLITELGAWKG